MFFFFFSSRRRHTRYWRDWSSDVCSSDLVEPEQQDPLPLAEAEVAGGERDLLAAWAEQDAEQPLALALVLRHQPGEQLLEVGEEARLALLHAHQRDLVGGRDVGDPAVTAGGGQLAPDLVRDVEHRQGRQCRRGRVRNLDARHAGLVTSRGRRKLTFSLATSTSPSSSKPNDASPRRTSATSSSGVEAPAVTPTVSWPASSSGSIPLSPSISSAVAPCRWATSTRRIAFELASEPITKIRLAPCLASSLTASWRFCVA